MTEELDLTELLVSEIDHEILSCLVGLCHLVRSQNNRHSLDAMFLEVGIFCARPFNVLNASASMVTTWKRSIVVVVT